MDSDDDLDCPLCMEELDIADCNFKPCPCGYQICRFCWHHIRENLNGRCPACRREYSEEMVEFQPISTDELTRIRKEKREKERQQKDMESANRKHLSSMRVVQKNLVYIIGLHPKYATEEIVRSHEFFGKFGNISKIVINKKPALPASQTPSQPSAAVYVTYFKKEEAAKAIDAVDGTVIADRVLRASYGTTKYCTYYLRNMSCPNPNCLYLHEQGEDIDTISKEELATGKHHMRDQMANDEEDQSSDYQDIASTAYRHSPQYQNRLQISSNYDFPSVSSTVRKSNPDDSALPASASWAKIGFNTSISESPTSTASASDSFGPTLSAAVATSQQKAQFPHMPKRKNEKKKKKEPVQKLSSDSTYDENASSTTTTPITASATLAISDSNDQGTRKRQEDDDDLPITPPQHQLSVFEQGLTGFVLGQAYRDLCPLPSEEEFAIKQQQDDTDVQEQLVLGVSSLMLDKHNNNEPSPAQRNLEAIQSAATTRSSKFLPTAFPSALDFLTYSSPTPKYNGMFNPFAHLSMLGGGQQQHNVAILNGATLTSTTAGNTNNNLVDSPIRRHSRFGFAQA